MNNSKKTFGHHPYHWIRLELLVITAIVLILAICCSARQAMIFFLIWQGIRGVLLFIGTSIRLRKRDRITHHNEYWAHWHYEPDEWDRVAQEIWNDYDSENRSLLLYGIACAICVGFITWLVRHSALDSLSMGIQIPLFISLITFQKGPIYGGLRASEGQVFISQHGIASTGPFRISKLDMFWPLPGKLIDVKLTTAPVPKLRFEGERRMLFTARRYQLDIPIPQNCYEEAEQLVTRLGTEVLLKNR